MGVILSVWVYKMSTRFDTIIFVNYALITDFTAEREARMADKTFRVPSAKVYIRRHTRRHTRAYPLRPTSGKVLVENLERITRGLTPEDIEDLERISRQHRRVR